MSPVQGLHHIPVGFGRQLEVEQLRQQWVLDDRIPALEGGIQPCLEEAPVLCRNTEPLAHRCHRRPGVGLVAGKQRAIKRCAQLVKGARHVHRHPRPPAQQLVVETPLAQDHLITACIEYVETGRVPARALDDRQRILVGFIGLPADWSLGDKARTEESAHLFLQCPRCLRCGCARVPSGRSIGAGAERQQHRSVSLAAGMVVQADLVGSASLLVAADCRRAVVRCRKECGLQGLSPIGAVLAIRAVHRARSACEQKRPIQARTRPSRTRH